MSKVTLDLTPQQITHAIDQLSNEAKIKLAKKLQDFAARMRVREILRRVDARKGTRPSTREILKEIHTYRNNKKHV